MLQSLFFTIFKAENRGTTKKEKIRGDLVNHLGKVVIISCYLGQDIKNRVYGLGLLGQNYKNVQIYMYMSIGNFNPVRSGDPPCHYVCPPLKPDIADAVRVVSMFMANPGKEHREAVKWILRHLRGSSDLALCFWGSDICLQGFVDSDLAGDIDSRKSTLLDMFQLLRVAVSWASRLQKIVTISTTETEYVAATKSCKEMVWLRSFMK